MTQPLHVPSIYSNPGAGCLVGSNQTQVNIYILDRQKGLTTSHFDVQLNPYASELTACSVLELVNKGDGSLH